MKLGNVTVGIDLAKNVFAVHGVVELGKPVRVRSEVPRAKLFELLANLPRMRNALMAIYAHSFKENHPRAYAT